ncbi:cytochrome c biogenesis protein CcdA [Trinickia terrae]|uniref:Cytochrome c biogenesis protein CcdA n=1 Tax=Trinickia terrae TaxID=2571161 RepID=A0A4U1I3F1_9BURK|nr:cytochrome c biogenesis CcdA family protein [Trinickia terrae]TKC87757.1 cytochrome c biogenesis protein CcdA [Trinickia terrae]
MAFTWSTYGLGLLAGALSTLSPCVLPLIPILMASALAAHRLGPLALAAGLGLSFAAIGIFLAAAGASLGLDNDVLRKAAAVLLIVFGAVMLSHRLQARFSRGVSPLAEHAQTWLAKLKGETVLGQFGIGLLLGAVWAPCVGPTLGAATTLAAQGQHLGNIAALMVCFGVGAALPLMLLGTFSHAALARFRGGIGATGATGRIVLGALFVASGVLIATGLDRQVEAALLAVSPDWLTSLTTSI